MNSDDRDDIRGVRGHGAIFLLTVQFLTRLPLPRSIGYSPARMAETPRYYPLVGALIGAACAGLYWAADYGLPRSISAALCVAFGVLFTGAFHEDGLADMADGIGGGLTRESAMDIMRDSRLGTYGAAALMFSIGLQVACLAAMNSTLAVCALIIGHGLSRLSAVIALATSDYARDHGTGKPVADGIGRAGLGIAVATGGALLAGLWIIDPAHVVPVLIGVIAGHALVRFVYERKLGGYTGDCLGALQQVSLVGIYLGLLWASGA